MRITRLRFTRTRTTCNPSDDGKTADARKEPVKHELKCILELREFDPGTRLYSGRVMQQGVVYLARGGSCPGLEGVSDDTVVMGITPRGLCWSERPRIASDVESADAVSGIDTPSRHTSDDAETRDGQPAGIEADASGTSALPEVRSQSGADSVAGPGGVQVGGEGPVRLREGAGVAPAVDATPDVKTRLGRINMEPKDVTKMLGHLRASLDAHSGEYDQGDVLTLPYDDFTDLLCVAEALWEDHALRSLHSAGTDALRDRITALRDSLVVIANNPKLDGEDMRICAAYALKDDDEVTAHGTRAGA